MGIQSSTALSNHNNGNGYMDCHLEIDTHSPEFQQLNKRFTISKTNQSESNQFASVLLLHEKLSNQKFILRILVSNDQEEIRKIENAILGKLATSSNPSYNSCLTKISQYMTRSQKNYCNTIHKCFIMFQLGNYINLSEYLLKYLQNNNVTPNKTKMYNILQSGLLNILQAIRWLRYFKHPHENITLQQIYIKQSDNNFILSDPWLGNTLINTQQQNYEAYNYYSPEKIKKIRNQIDVYDQFVSDVFSLGVVGLKAAKIIQKNSNYGDAVNLGRFYNRALKKIDLMGIHCLIQTVPSQELRELLSVMLGSIEDRYELLRKNNVGEGGQIQNKQPVTFIPRRLGGKKMAKMSSISEVRKSFDRKQNMNQIYETPRQNLKGSVCFTYLPQNTNFKQPMAPSYTNHLTSSVNYSPTYNNTNFQISPRNYMTSSLPSQHPYQNPTTPRFNPPPVNNNNPNYVRPPMFPNQPLYKSIYATVHQSNNRQHNYNKNIIGVKSATIFPSYEWTQNFRVNNGFQREIERRNLEKNGLIEKSAFQKKQSFIKIDDDQQISNLQLNQKPTKTKSQPSLLSQPNLQIPPTKSPLQNKTVESIIFVSNTNPQKNLKSSPSSQSILLSMRSFGSENRSFEEEINHRAKLFDDLKMLESKIGDLISHTKNQQEEEKNRRSTQELVTKQEKPQKPSIIIAAENDIKNTLTDSEKKLFTRQTQEKEKIVESQILFKNNKQFDFLRDIPLTDLAQSQLKLKLSSDQLHKNNESNQSNINIDVSSSSIENSELPPNSEVDDKEEKKVQQQNRKKQNQVAPNSINSMVYQPVAPPASIPSSHRLIYHLTIPEEHPQDFSQSEISSINSSWLREAKENETHQQPQYVQQNYENGGKYEGYKLKNKRHGEGTFYYKDGGFYKGRWRQNMMHGYGCLYYDNQKLAYQGQWYQDQFHGRGKVYNDRPQKLQDNEMFDYRNMNQAEAYWQYYTGYLNHDMKQFMGKMVLSNGQYYEGEFSGDMVDGKGKFYRKDGEIVRGVWKQGVLEREF